MVAAKIIRPFGHALLSRLFPRQRTTSDNRETGEGGRARRYLVARRFHDPAEEICASARQTLAANDVCILSSGRGNCGEGTCGSGSILGWTRIYPRFGESVASKDAEIRRVRSIAKKSRCFVGEFCFSRTAEIVVYTCSILGLPAEVVYRGDAGIAQLVEQLICNQQVIGSSPIAGSLYFRFSIYAAVLPARRLMALGAREQHSRQQQHCIG